MSKCSRVRSGVKELIACYDLVGLKVASISHTLNIKAEIDSFQISWACSLCEFSLEECQIKRYMILCLETILVKVILFRNFIQNFITNFVLRIKAPKLKLLD